MAASRNSGFLRIRDAFGTYIPLYIYIYIYIKNLSLSIYLSISLSLSLSPLREYIGYLIPSFPTNQQ